MPTWYELDWQNCFVFGDFSPIMAKAEVAAANGDPLKWMISEEYWGYDIPVKDLWAKLMEWARLPLAQLPILIVKTNAGTYRFETERKNQEDGDKVVAQLLHAFDGPQFVIKVRAGKLLLLKDTPTFQ